jgi:hypothetical protein
VSRALRWYASRLRAMSIAEIAYRSYRAARYPIDQLRMRTHRYARPSLAMRAHIGRWQGPEPFYFDRELHVTEVSPELRDEAEAICAGKRRVLGLGWIDVPSAPWHYEPSAHYYWPRVDAARVVRAAPAHFDPRLTWELNRGHEWVVLARVYASTREPRFLDQLVRELISWRRANPIGIGINWTSAMEAAIRIHSLVWCAAFLRGTIGIQPTLAEMIYEHAIVVSDHRSYFSSGNNHLIVELTALIVAALTLGGELARLHARALARLTMELDRQIFSDGVNAEMATHYHVFVLEALVLVAYLQRAHAMPSPKLEAVVGRMADYIEEIRCTDGSLLQQGDSDDGCIVGLLRPRHPDQILAAARALYTRARRHETAQAVPHEGAFWLTGGTWSALHAEPQARSRRFRPSGQVILRSGRLHAAIDAGPFGFGRLSAHAHCDALSITLAVDGRRVLVDRGTYRYNGDADARDHYRCTAAHNTAQIGSLEQASAAGAFLWSRRPTATIHRCDLTEHGDIVQASHDGFAGWLHRRTLVHRHGLLVIVDEFLGSGPAQHVVGRYHFAPELAVVPQSSSRFRIEHGSSPLLWLISNARQARVTETGHSDEYARIASAPTIELAGTSDRALITAMVPVGAEVALERIHHWFDTSRRPDGDADAPPALGVRSALAHQDSPVLEVLHQLLGLGPFEQNIVGDRRIRAHSVTE